MFWLVQAAGMKEDMVDIYIQSWRLEVPHAVCGEGPLLGSRMAVFSPCPLMEESKRSKLPAVASCKGTDLIHAAPDSWPHVILNTSQRLLLQIYHHIGGKVSTCEFGGDTSILPIMVGIPGTEQ